VSVPPPDDRPAFGWWPSPVSAEDVALAATTFDAVQMTHDGTVYWVENRPADGRDVIVGWSETKGQRVVSPAGTDVGSRVNAYGGGAYLAEPDAVWYCNAADERIYRCQQGEQAAPVVPPAAVPGTAGYADLRGLPDRRRLVCVRELREDRDVTHDLVAIPSSGGQPRVLHSGWDFYAAPRPSPDGRHLAWTTWSNPLMPWDGSWLWVAELDEGGDRLAGPPQHVAGGQTESAVQPQWSPDGVLHFVSDRSGWWNLYRWGHQVETVLIAEAEMSAAPWEFGYVTYAFLHDGSIAALLQTGPTTRLGLLPAEGALDPIPLPYTSIKPYLATDGRRIALIGASPTQLPTVALVDPASGGVRELAGGIRAEQQLATVSAYAPDPVRFGYPTRDGATAHGIYYPPTNPQVTASSSAPPLIVRAHPGPTANTTLRLDPAVVFFTSRGFAVADVDYRGSTGYGRAYRQALHGRWGEMDAQDCADAVDHLAAVGHADPQRAVITGASAGGYTALRALATTDVFRAATARSAIVDPAAWRQTAPAFQRHHADALVGPWPATAEIYRERSPLAHPDRISRPVLLIHGEDDPMAPASHARALVDALSAQDIPVTARFYAREGHAIRSPDHAADALHAELDHYRQALGLR